MNIPFSPPYIDQDVIDEVVDSLNSGWITTGPKVRDLEIMVSKYVGVEKTLCVNSATSGLQLMLQWYGIGPGDEVIVPAYTYVATALTVLHRGATPIMVDVSDDFTISVDAIRNAITPKTKAIVPVDIAGWPCDYSKIMELVNSSEIKSMFRPENEVQEKLGRIMVMSDAAHSIGATYHGIKMGAVADCTVFSFHAVKNVTTAEGGCVSFNFPEPFKNEEVYAYLKLFSLNGQTKDAFSKAQAGSWRYDIIYPGVKINMPDILAAIGLVQLRKYDDLLLAERRRVFDAYNSIFSKTDWAQIPPVEENNRVSSCHLYALRINNVTEDQRDAIISEISKHGVAVNVHFIPMPMLTIFKERGYSIDDYPVTYDNYSREISLPIYPQLDQEKIDYITSTVISAYDKCVK